MTEADLTNAQFKDISILEIEDNKKVLILLSENEETAKRLYDIISHNDYDLQVSIGEKNEYNIKMTFINTEWEIFFKTGKTIEEYFPLSWLANSSVQYITTGFKGEGQNRHWDHQYLNLIRPTLN